MDYSLNVAFVYQDERTLKWAAQVCDQVTQLAGKEAVRSTWWEIDRLGDPEMLADAVLTTRQADVIVVSVYDAKELPADFYVWIDAWLPYRRRPSGALVALIGLFEQPGVQPNHAKDYLSAVARQGRLDFLLRERTLTPASRGLLPLERITESAHTPPRVLQEATSHDHNHCCCGVNE